MSKEYGMSGGEKLEAALEKIAKKAEASLQVGFFENEKYPDGTSVAQVAFRNEYGTSKIPARPFFRTAIARNKSDWGRIFRGFFKRRKLNAELAFADLGSIIAEQITDSINTWTTPPNSPRTIKKKGFNAPLRHTKQMLRAPTFEVKK